MRVGSPPAIPFCSPPACRCPNRSAHATTHLVTTVRRCAPPVAGAISTSAIRTARCATSRKKQVSGAPWPMAMKTRPTASPCAIQHRTGAAPRRCSAWWSGRLPKFGTARSFIGNSTKSAGCVRARKSRSPNCANLRVTTTFSRCTAVTIASCLRPTCPRLAPAPAIFTRCWTSTKATPSLPVCGVWIEARARPRC